jgi:hypothetical protein
MGLTQDSLGTRQPGTQVWGRKIFPLLYVLDPSPVSHYIPERASGPPRILASISGAPAALSPPSAPPTTTQHGLYLPLPPLFIIIIHTASFGRKKKPKNQTSALFNQSPEENFLLKVEVCLISPTPTYVGDRMPEYSAGTLGNC